MAHKAAVKQSRARIKDEMSRSLLIDMNEYEKHRWKVSKANKMGQADVLSYLHGYVLDDGRTCASGAFSVILQLT
ncbi:hypothetical protein SASPL_121092 [Salvia splendens]|uniref:Uncharacterized protein n=1 Tax=Salvia splendens TaxID=180675 RepID=A0A8X8ZW89_SALSN|nr:hypothetical protein SASPL_121092 [Salvia splendens]